MSLRLRNNDAMLPRDYFVLILRAFDSIEIHRQVFSEGFILLLSEEEFLLAGGMTKVGPIGSPFTKSRSP